MLGMYRGNDYFAGVFQRFLAAFRAMDLRLAGDSFAARALPPFNPPSLPSATALGFFSCVAWATTEAAI
jgi:hypothetical protein